jgi:hypothetical protein
MLIPGMRGLLIALFTVLLGGCLGTSYPIWTAKESETIASLPGKWYLPDGPSISISALSTGGYEVHQEKGGTAKFLLAPLKGNFHIVQMYSEEDKTYYYGIVEMKPEMIVLRSVEMLGTLADRAEPHGIQPGSSTGREQFVDTRVVSKRDVTAFFKDVIALNAWSHEMVSQIPIMRNPPPWPQTTPPSKAPAQQRDPAYTNRLQEQEGKARLEADRLERQSREPYRSPPLKEIAPSSEARKRRYEPNLGGDARP